MDIFLHVTYLNYLDPKSLEAVKSTENVWKGSTIQEVEILTDMFREYFSLV